MNVLSMYALLGAYSDEGAEWADELCQVLSSNVTYACAARPLMRIAILLHKVSCVRIDFQYDR